MFRLILTKICPWLKLPNPLTSVRPTFPGCLKRATGSSPHRYVIQQRVERAKELLKTTDLAIANIALQVWFFLVKVI